jgi:hypothetical protein
VNGKTLENHSRDSAQNRRSNLTQRYQKTAVFCGCSTSVSAKPARYCSNSYGLQGKPLPHRMTPTLSGAGA